MRYDACHAETVCLLPFAFCLVGACCSPPLPASADLTAFLGRTTTPEPPQCEGPRDRHGPADRRLRVRVRRDRRRSDVAPGAGLPSRPALKTYMFNGLLQTPVPIARMQFYGTLGGGVYHETLSTQPNDDRDQLRHQHRRRREDHAGRTAPVAARLPRVLAAGHAAPDQRAAGLRGDQSEILSGIGIGVGVGRKLDAVLTGSCR